jgi:hypothetical protein
MDKGIRPAANAKFLELIPTRVKTREGNTAFRKTVIGFIMEEFGATLASAATHYNHAFINARTLAATNPELAGHLEGLGRPEDKKGGRKPKAKPEAAPATNDDSATMSDVASSVMLGGDDSSDDAPPPAAQITLEASQVGLEGLGQQEEAPQGDAPQEPAVQTFSVYKVAKGTLVAEGLTREQADELVAKAAAAKKAKLEVR